MYTLEDVYNTLKEEKFINAHCFNDCQKVGYITDQGTLTQKGINFLEHLEEAIDNG